MKRPTRPKQPKKKLPSKPRPQSGSTIRLGRTAIPVLFEDRDLMAIDKPAGWLVTTPKWSRTRQNLQREIELAIQRRDSWVARHHLRFLRYIHRLDRETSGVLLLAKNRLALSQMSRQFAQQQVTKCYLCQVAGVPAIPAWTCTAPLATSDSTPPRVRVNSRHGQQATTHFKVIGTDSKNAILIAAPRTGRTHQIRVHLAAAGHAILGDPLYGNAKGKSPSPFVSPAMQLRAWGLQFNHPKGRRPIRIEAAADSFRQLLRPGSDWPSLSEALRWVEEWEQKAMNPVSESGRLPIPKPD